ncbi:MAG: thioredoxin domain-containing protein, partial [Cryobacterium sp.]
PAAASPDAGFRAPEGADPVLTGQGLDLATDPSEGAYPSGLSAISTAAWRLYLLTGDTRYRDAATAGMVRLVGTGDLNPLAFGAALRLVNALTTPVEQLVVVTPDPAAAGDALVDAARRRQGLVAVVTQEQAEDFAAAGFELFAERGIRQGRPTAYLCRDFVCRLPTTDAAALA